MDRSFIGGGRQSTSVLRVLRDLLLHPIRMIGRRWNWKAAVLSSTVRALIFFCVNLTAGLHAAFAALLTELIYRGAASGFYGAITEGFRFAEPEWVASLVVLILLPLMGHSTEFVVHFLRGTANLKVSILASVCFTAASTLFNLYAMRRGALITGAGQQTLTSDLKRMPMLMAGFLAAGPLALSRLLGGKIGALAQPPLSVRPAPQETSD